MAQVTKEQREEVIANFNYEGNVVNAIPYGSGHINDTFLLTIDNGGKETERAILQKMNKSIFQQPVELMENVMKVTSHLREKVIEAGGDPDRETLNVILSQKGEPYYVDSTGEFWRSYKFIAGAS